MLVNFGRGVNLSILIRSILLLLCTACIIYPDPYMNLIAFGFFFLLPSFSLLGSALGFFLFKGSFSLTPSGFCSDYRWFSILVRGAGRWLDGQGLFWRMMMISHVCSCVCASWLSARLQMAQCPIIGRSGNTHTNSWLHEHGKWSRLNPQSRVPVACLDFSKRWQLESKPRKTLKKDYDVFICNVTLAETTHAGWRHAAGVLVRREGSTLGTCAWQRAWTHEVL